MLYSFTVVSHEDATEPSALYFAQVAQNAKVAITQESAGTTLGRTLAACEFLDCVDNEDLPMDKGLYQKCLGFVLETMASLTDHDLNWLRGRSWAVSSLCTLMDEGHLMTGAAEAPEPARVLAFG